jgi:hypothetical protein
VLSPTRSFLGSLCRCEYANMRILPAASETEGRERRQSGGEGFRNTILKDGGGGQPFLNTI